MGTELIEVQFSGTFDASAGNFVTFELTAAESATLGALTAGTEYSAVLRSDDDQATAGGSQFRIVRSGTTANPCLLYTSPSPRDQRGSRMPSSA